MVHMYCKSARPNDESLYPMGLTRIYFFIRRQTHTEELPKLSIFAKQGFDKKLLFAKSVKL